MSRIAIVYCCKQAIVTSWAYRISWCACWISQNTTLVANKDCFIDLSEDLCIVLISFSCLNKCDKRYFQQRRKAKPSVCQLTGVTGSSHKKALHSSWYRFVCFLFVCLLVATENSAASYCLCWLLGKNKGSITPSHRGSGLTRWSPKKWKGRQYQLQFISLLE